ncbi:MAG: arabinan endo-1,5-alpha-L-arabinosidase [Chitinophagaceae bacterium]
MRILLLVSFINGSVFAQKAKSDSIIENNGLKGQLVVHDPVMIKQGDTYYVFSTGMRVKTSKDRINWLNAGNVFGRDSIKFSWWNNDIKDKIGLWAPDIHYSNGKYQLYYSVSAWMNFNSSIGLTTNTTLNPADPAYKWTDEGKVIDFRNGGEGVNVIDPNIFIDKDKKKYLVYGSYKAGLRLVELDYKTGKLKKDPPDITTITTVLGEGSFIIKGPIYYYVFASRGRCCAGDSSTYQIVTGRSTNVKGPYVNKEGESWVDNKYTLFLAGDSTEHGRGHNGFFTEHDTTFIVYHAYTHSAGGASLLNIKPMYIDNDGWPTMDASQKLFKRKEYNFK